MNPTVKIENLSHAFAKRQVLRNLSFNVESGNFFVIIGPNGSGKTTLLKLMAGILRSHSGKIEIRGRVVHSYTSKALARAKPRSL